MENHQLVLVLDFGGQYNQLIARRVREHNVFCEVKPYKTSIEEIKAMTPIGIIFTGGPNSVYEETSPKCDPALFDLGIPVLGICYGCQLMAHTLGGQVTAAQEDTAREYGKTRTFYNTDCKLFKGLPAEGISWMSHGDYMAKVPEGFELVAHTDACPTAAIANEERGFYGVQYHPEVNHTENGSLMLRNFLYEICHAKGDWTMEDYKNTSIKAIREKVGDGKVLLALSGGVDSSVAAALLAEAVGDQLTCVFVDHGLMRKNEGDEVEEAFSKWNLNLIRMNEEDEFLAALKGLTDPEDKRKAIGAQFIRTFEKMGKEIGAKVGKVDYLAQGTIYPDIIESGARKTGGKTATIKSHHNLIPFPEGVHFDLIEPLDHFFKDEVRALGLALGLPGHIVFRQPFPGPGLAIRIIGAVDKEKLEILKNADAIVREELDAYNQRLFEQTGERNSEHSCWQYFAVLPDIKSVGVMGDERTYQRPIILRAVESSDAMTADWAKLPYDVLARISGRIVAEVPGANRVCYDITSKPPATIEWE